MHFPDVSSHSSKLSSNSLKIILEKLLRSKHRPTTKRTYLSVWRKFNSFVIQLDHIPGTLEERVSLYVGYLAAKGIKSTTIKSYISGIKAILADDQYEWDEEAIKICFPHLGCRMINDRMRTRLPIGRKLLELILEKLEVIYLEELNQPYLTKLLSCLFILGYYGLLRIGGDGFR